MILLWIMRTKTGQHKPRGSSFMNNIFMLCNLLSFRWRGKQVNPAQCFIEWAIWLVSVTCIWVCYSLPNSYLLFGQFYDFTWFWFHCLYGTCNCLCTRTSFKFPFSCHDKTRMHICKLLSSGNNKTHGLFLFQGSILM